MITEAVILAAGQGTRIRAVSRDLPKPLVTVGGKTLLQSGVDALLSMGIEKIVCVVGYQHQEVRDYAAGMPWHDAIVFVQNDEWQKENGLSVYAAREALHGEFFLLQMVDHLFDAAIYERALAARHDAGISYLCIDRDIAGVHDPDDATKLVVRPDTSIASIAKNLTEYNAVDCGLFVMHTAIFGFFEQAIRAGRNTISNSVEDAGRAGSFRTIDITGARWIDVDTEEAWQEATRRVQGG
ncbi:MAG: NTP transferase domain-containing protein [Spirochaetota bacterium]|jgi:choline kinase|nr:NTP transferase domain-containing protein [Spirochaetota bacterium]